jgi:hypothetical protein
MVPCPPVRYRAADGGTVEVTVFPLLVENAADDTAGTLAADVAGQIAAARAAGHTSVVVSSALGRPAEAGTPAEAVRAPEGFELPPGFGVDGDPRLLPAELAAALTP